MPKWTRMDYTMVAAVLKSSETKKEMRNKFIAMFVLDNPRFDEARFREASGEQLRSPSKTTGGGATHVRSHPRRGTKGVRAHTRRR